MSDFQVVEQLVNGIGIGGLGEFIALFMYQGFSPELVFKHLTEVKTKKNISDSEFTHDMKTIIVMGVIMGNFNDHNSERIAEEGKTKGNALMAKYDLKKGSLGTQKKAVNVPRIIAAFPSTSHRVFMSCSAKNYNGPFSANSLQQELKSPVFPAIIPQGLDKALKKMLMAAHTCYSAEQTMALSKTGDAKAAYTQQIAYTDIAHNSTVPSEAERVTLFGKITVNKKTIGEVLLKLKEIVGISVDVV